MRKFQQLLAAFALALSLGEPAISETSKYNQLKGKQLQADTKCRHEADCGGSSTSPPTPTPQNLPVPNTPLPLPCAPGQKPTKGNHC